MFKHKDAIEAYLSKTERQLFDLSETLRFFDLTNTHFEGQVLGNPKAKFGRSKQKRSDCRLLTLALIVDELGFVKCSQLKFVPWSNWVCSIFFKSNILVMNDATKEILS